MIRLLLSIGLLLSFALHASADHAALAQGFLDTLDAEEVKMATLPYDDARRTKWHFIPMKDRKGLPLNKMTEKQRASAITLYKSVLSKAGYQQLKSCMDSEAILNDIEKAPERRDPLKYYWTVFGKPDAKGVWGLSVEGHHMSSNFVFKDNALVCATPLFIGTNPHIIREDRPGRLPKGTRILDDEEDLALELLHLLDDKQKKSAIIAEKPKRDLDEGHKAQLNAKPAGLSAAEMTGPQRAALLNLVGSYLDYLPADFAKAFRADIDTAGVEKLQFSWSGAAALDKPHSYQVFGPTFAILFYNTQKGATGLAVDHGHALLRSNGHDFFLGGE